MSTRENVQAVIDGILQGKIMETFEKYYDDDVVMSENGVEPRVGKATNREYEQYFVDNAEVFGAEVGNVIVDGDVAAVEWTFDMRPPGSDQRVTMKQATVQTWKNGKIVNEVFYHL